LNASRLHVSESGGNGEGKGGRPLVLFPGSRKVATMSHALSSIQ